MSVVEMLIFNGSIILLSIVWWMRVVPVRSYLSSLIISFGLGILAVWMQIALMRMAATTEPGKVDSIAFIWFIVICVLSAQTVWTDKWGKEKLGKVPRRFRRSID